MFRATTADHFEECRLLIDFNEKEKKISHPAKMWSLAQLLLLNNKSASSKKKLIVDKSETRRTEFLENADCSVVLVVWPGTSVISLAEKLQLQSGDHKVV